MSNEVTLNFSSIPEFVYKQPIRTYISLYYLNLQHERSRVTSFDTNNILETKRINQRVHKMKFKIIFIRLFPFFLTIFFCFMGFTLS